MQAFLHCCKEQSSTVSTWKIWNNMLFLSIFHNKCWLSCLDVLSNCGSPYDWLLVSCDWWDFMVAYGIHSKKCHSNSASMYSLYFSTFWYSELLGALYLVISSRPLLVLIFYWSPVQCLLQLLYNHHWYCYIVCNVVILYYHYPISYWIHVLYIFDWEFVQSLIHIVHCICYMLVYIKQFFDWKLYLPLTGYTCLLLYKTVHGIHVGRFYISVSNMFGIL